MNASESITSDSDDDPKPQPAQSYTTQNHQYAAYMPPDPPDPPNLFT